MKKNNINYSDLEKERIITIVDLLREIWRRFWIVVVLVVLFAALLGGYKYYKDMQSAQKNNAEAEYVAKTSSLSEEEIEEVDNILFAKANMDEQQNYVNNSVLMQIDPFDESTVILQYHVEVPDSDAAEMYSQDLMKSYEGYINNGALAASIVEDGYSLEVQYLGELLNYSVENETGNEDDSSISSVSSDSSTFDLKIIQVNQDSAEGLADLIVSDLESYKEVLDDSVGDHDLILVDRSYSRIVDTALRTYKYDRINSINTMKEKVEEMEADLSSAQIEYMEQAETSQAEILAGDEAEVTAVATTSVHINRRYVLLGALVGLILAILYIVLAYILRGQINTANDIRYLYNLRVLGELRTVSGDDGKTIRKRHVRISPEKQIDLLVANLKDACQEKNIQKILFAGSGKLEQDQKLAQKLGEALKEYAIETEYVADLPYSIDAINLMEDYKAIVLLEKIRYSDYNTIEAEMRTCLEHEATIIGAVVFS